MRVVILLKPTFSTTRRCQQSPSVPVQPAVSSACQLQISGTLAGASAVRAHRPVDDTVLHGSRLALAGPFLGSFQTHDVADEGAHGGPGRAGNPLPHEATATESRLS